MEIWTPYFRTLSKGPCIFSDDNYNPYLLFVLTTHLTPEIRKILGEGFSLTYRTKNRNGQLRVYVVLLVDGEEYIVEDYQRQRLQAIVDRITSREIGCLLVTDTSFVKDGRKVPSWWLANILPNMGYTYDREGHGITVDLHDFPDYSKKYADLSSEVLAKIVRMFDEGYLWSIEDPHLTSAWKRVEVALPLRTSEGLLLRGNFEAVPDGLDGQKMWKSSWMDGRITSYYGSMVSFFDEMQKQDKERTTIRILIDGHPVIQHLLAQSEGSKGNISTFFRDRWIVRCNNKEEASRLVSLADEITAKAKGTALRIFVLQSSWLEKYRTIAARRNMPFASYWLLGEERRLVASFLVEEGSSLVCLADEIEAERRGM